MAIKVKSLEPKKGQGILISPDTVFRDLALDFSMESTGSAKNLLSNTTKKDLDTDIDFKAIDNSITNIFNTAPGQKILNPSFGADLKRYLFQPVTEETAKILGEVILQALTLYEPRVKVKNVNIKAYPDQYTYRIDIICTIPALNNQQYRYTGTTSKRGVVQVSGNFGYTPQ